MANKNSHAGHKPERTCVVCRQKKYKKDLFRFVIIDKKIVIDFNQTLMGRGFYVCSLNECLVLLDKWLFRKSKRKKKR